MTSEASHSYLPASRLQARMLLLLTGVTLAIFGQVCGFEFVHYDDNVTIYHNSHIQGLTWANLKWMFTDFQYARRYMPLGWLSYAIDFQFFGLNPQAYHTGNLVLHLVNVVLLFFLLKRIVLRLHPDKDSNEQAERATIWCAGLGTLFWAVNPLRVESVAWASARIYSLAFLFSMLWLLAWLRAQDPELPSPRRAVFYWCSLGAFAASLLTYPLALFAPVVLFALDWSGKPRREKNLPTAQSARPAFAGLWSLLPFVAITVIILAPTFFALNNTPRYRPVTLSEFPLFSRVMQAFYIWAYYLWKPWAPYDLAMNYMTLHSFNPLAPMFVLSAALIVGVSGALVLSRRHFPGVLALWGCHLVLLIPVLGLSEYPHSPADRYSYLHGALWAAALALGLRHWSARSPRGQLAGMALAGACGLFALSAWQQTPVWRDTIPLYQNLLARAGNHPDRSRSDIVLGVHYLRAGLTNQAIASFQNAIHFEVLRPDRWFFDEGVLQVAHCNLGDILLTEGRLEEAASHYLVAARSDPRAGWAAAKAGSALLKLDRIAEATDWLQTAVRLQPDNPRAKEDLAAALQKRGLDEETTERSREPVVSGGTEVKPSP